MKKTRPRTILLIASGDLRQSANETCWPAQAAMEQHQQTIWLRNFGWLLILMKRAGLTLKKPLWRPYCNW